MFLKKNQNKDDLRLFLLNKAGKALIKKELHLFAKEIA
tara:strand:+ start:2268 stop:2381 length:114 start_codon:yes stop_codon:yes gene_type:complete